MDPTRDRLVVAVFGSPNQAYAAAADLQRLADDGVIALTRGAIVGKDAEGNLSAPDSSSTPGGPWRLLVGGLLGGATGALLGPAGAAAGAAAGAGVGATADVLALGFGMDHVYEVGAGLGPGQWALLAEVGRGPAEPVDAAVQRHQGRVRRDVRS
jgi:uncharacterized membrane protein